MAFAGPWGVFIHIPKTGGQWARRVLRTTTTGDEDGPVHGLPIEGFLQEKFCFTFVRDPATWLRSYWGHRVRDSTQGFKSTKSDGQAWNDLVRITLPYMDYDFDIFALNVCEYLPGLVGWFFNCYTPPSVRWEHQEEMAKYLNMWYPKCVPESIEAINRFVDRVKVGPPRISRKLRTAIFDAELSTYERYNYTMGGEYHNVPN